MDRAQGARAFRKAIGELEDSLRRCPDELWRASMWHVPRTDPWVWPKLGVEPVPERTDEAIQIFSAVASIAYHCLWFLDFYATTDPPGFRAPEYVRGGPEEMAWPGDGAAPLPPGVFPKEVLLRYLDYGRQRVEQRIAHATATELAAVCPPGHPQAGKSLVALLRVNLAHIREHARQISGFLLAQGVT
ncbi:MAG: DinB family protein, partial [Candidatus Dormibacteria bacterium]